MAIIAVNIGSNIGDRRRLLKEAIRHLSDKFGFYGESDTIESESWGFSSENKFLNVGIVFKSELQPEKLLDEIQKIEKEISSAGHRDENGNYIDREIDIDIMAIDNVCYESPRLTIPHSCLPEREFFLKPLSELIPDWNHPKNGKSVSEMLKKLTKGNNHLE